MYRKPNPKQILPKHPTINTSCINSSIPYVVRTYNHTTPHTLARISKPFLSPPRGGGKCRATPPMCMENFKSHHIRCVGENRLCNQSQSVRCYKGTRVYILTPYQCDRQNKVRYFRSFCSPPIITQQNRYIYEY